MGGTTAKASAVEDGRVVLKSSGDFFDIPLNLDLPLLRSIALGGGSVARVAEGQVILGPDSMGAAPGPVCYGLGGRSATVTDAFVAAGFVSPTAFLGGKRVLDVDKARTALEKQVGKPLGISADEAAQAVVEAAWDAVAQLARETAEEVGWDPSECGVYAYGGNGPLFVTAVADRLGARSARFFRYGHVYSAFGSAISDVVHVYESAVTAGVSVGQAADRLAGEARRDLRGEGFDPSRADLHWEIRSDGHTVRGEGDHPSVILASIEGEPALLRLTARYPLPASQRGGPRGGAAGAGRAFRRPPVTVRHRRAPSDLPRGVSRGQHDRGAAAGRRRFLHLAGHRRRVPDDGHAR
ncbi:hydantoinase/oxoprolinase family protein [Streptomyces sp. NPDC020951]|uniref:hydantoinase/oxoprolinase family protein n=1 Tax=Streptomyces sp. NPDC020951 TaxID=3365104 RepID=UPI00378F9F38